MQLPNDKIRYRRNLIALNGLTLLNNSNMNPSMNELTPWIVALKPKRKEQKKIVHLLLKIYGFTYQPVYYDVQNYAKFTLIPQYKQM